MALTVTRRYGRVVVAGLGPPRVPPDRSRPTSANLEPELVTVPAPRRRGRRRRRSPRRSPTTPRPWSSSTRTSSASSRRSTRLVAGRPRQGGAGDRQRRPDQPGPAPPARRLRRRHRGGRGPGAGQPDVVRRPVPGHHGLPRGVRPQDARPDRRPDDRPPRQALLGADAPDPRAAHPPREGDVEHLHQPGAARPAGEHLPRRHGPGGPPPGRRALDPQGPLRRRAAGRGPGPVAGLRRARSSRSSWSASREGPDARPRRGRPPRLPRRDRPGPLVSRPGRLHPRRRDREADPRRDRRPGRGLRAGARSV